MGILDLNCIADLQNYLFYLFFIKTYNIFTG